jgi:hypothetical protein
MSTVSVTFPGGEKGTIKGTLLYAKNPRKPLDGFVAMESGRLVAHAAITGAGARPLEHDEVRRVFAVNLCPVCHDEGKDPIYRSRLDYDALAARRPEGGEDLPRGPRRPVPRRAGARVRRAPREDGVRVLPLGVGPTGVRHVPGARGHGGSTGGVLPAPHVGPVGEERTSGGRTRRPWG